MIEGKPGELVKMRKQDILIPHEYQRTLNKGRSSRIAREFNWYLFGTLTISYRPPDYYCLDGMHRHDATLMVPEIDLLPCMLYDFDGPQHEAEIFALLQMNRKSLVTQDLHKAELYASGEFGATARRAQAFIDTLYCESVPLSTIRQLWRRKPEAFANVEDLVPGLVGEATLRKDFIEALVYLEAAHLEDKTGTIPPIDTQMLMDTGYEMLVALMLRYEHETAGERIGKVASPRLKADALRWALSHGHTLEPVRINGVDIGARVLPSELVNHDLS